MQVKRIEAPPQAQGSVLEPVGCFLADEPETVEGFTVPEDGSASVLVVLPVGLAVLESACLGSVFASLDDLAEMDDDQVRVWALFEAFGQGTVRAMHRLPAPDGQGPGFDLSAEPAATFVRVLRARLCAAFGFPAAGAGDVDQAVTVPVPVQGSRVRGAA